MTACAEKQRIASHYEQPIVFVRAYISVFLSFRVDAVSKGRKFENLKTDKRVHIFLI
jgi:hypothetical protein